MYIWKKLLLNIHFFMVNTIVYIEAVHQSFAFTNNDLDTYFKVISPSNYYGGTSCCQLYKVVSARLTLQFPQN